MDLEICFSQGVCGPASTLAAYAVTSRCTLTDQGARIVEARARGESTVELTVDLIVGVAKALAEEFSNAHLIYRLGPEDILYDPDSCRYFLDTEVERHLTTAAPPNMTLLDNGINAPELAGQLSRPLSASTTVYGTAALLYYAATGLEPVSELSRLADALPPIRIFEPDLPAGIDPVIRRALGRRPEDRFSDPGTFHAALEAVVRLHAERDAANVDGPVVVRFATATHTGVNKGHKNPQNQDRCFSAYNRELELGLFVVADGVSTCDYGSGERAAVKVTDAAAALWDELQSDASQRVDPSWRDDQLYMKSLARIFTHANEAVIEELRTTFPGGIDGSAAVMSSTAVAALLNGRRLVLANLGDSRVYVVRGGLVDQLTVDMNRRTSLLRAGKGLEAVLNTSGLSHLTARVGSYTVAAPGSRIEPSATAATYAAMNALPGDRILVCSDGVPDCIGTGAQERIGQIVSAADRPAQAAWDLMVAANQGGGDDNITAVVIDIT